MSENTEEFSSNALVVISNEFTSTPIGLTKSASDTINNDIDDAPRILCNELIVNPHKSKSLEKLDELSSLEREIAKMHHADDANIGLDEAMLSSSSAQAANTSEQLQIMNDLANITGDNDLSNGQPIVSGVQDPNSDKVVAVTSEGTALEHEDLIAVLKGLDDGNGDETQNNNESSILEEGVTIEGEGEYQIMEVIDDDSNMDDAKPEVVNTESANTTPTNNKTKTFGSTVLTAQEERALALEQMEVLKTAAQRRRKQDIKPIKQIDPALELVSALEADWSENDEDLSNDTPKPEVKTKSASASKAKTVTSTSASKSSSDNKSNSPLITSVVVIPSPVVTTATSTSSTSVASVNPPNKNDNSSGSSVSSSSSGNTDEGNKKSNSIESVIETKTEETQVLSSHTGFRRTRIIKRKIIWDPDAPETTFSYAKLVKPSGNKSTTTSITKGSTTITPIKKETATTSTPTTTTATKKTPRPITPKAKKLSTVDLNTTKTTTTKTENNATTKTPTDKDTTTKSNNKTDETKEAETSTSLETEATASPATATTSSTKTTPPKRRSQTPVANGPGGVKKKKITEVDRLMGDEGAVNMLNSLEKLEATLGAGDAKPSRPMMRSRAATICEKPRKDTTSPQRTTPPAAASTSQQTTKGKRTPKSRASASSSWDYVYKKTKKQDFEDSLIIRRRSNSSYSSTTSLNRLSLDGPPSSIGNDSKSLPASSSENDLTKTPPTTSSHNKSAGSLKSRGTPTPPAAGSKSFEFAKPENKKSQKRTKSPAATLTNDMKKAAPVAGRRSNARSPATTTTTNEDKVKDKDVKTTPPSKSPTNAKEKKDNATASAGGAPSTSTISDVVVKKASKVAQILFSTNKAKLNNTFTIQMLNKLVDILDKLATDPDCHAVVMGTNDNHFCQGIDLTDLMTISAEKRKNYAVTLATSVKNYLKTLATYPKPLIGGVSGNLMNLGVVQLALFDVVIASDKTTFETPYAKMGQIPEGYCIWHNMNKIRGSFKTKLFWLGERIQSTEAALAGLVNKLTAANKVNDDAFAAAKRIASLSVESYRIMKKTAINSNLDVIVNSLDEEFDAIIKQWTSTECIETIKKYLGHD